jgi:hypothetical protein
MKPTLHVKAAVLACALAGLVACGGMPGASGAQPSLPWDQDTVTHLAGQLRSQMESLYTMAGKEPAFAGERSAYGKTLDNIRILQEESGELHKKLSDGEGYEDTVRTYERIKEIYRDTRESESWEFLPGDFNAEAGTAWSVLSQLDTYFGAR